MVVKINENYLKLKSSYLFVEVARREAEFQKNNPDADIIKMGIEENYHKSNIPTIDGYIRIMVDNFLLTIRARRYNEDGSIGELICFNIGTPVDKIFKKLFPKEYRKEQLEKIKNI